MLRTNTTLWRIAFLSGFGVLPGACGGQTDAPAPLGTDTPNGDTTNPDAPRPSATVPSVTPTTTRAPGPTIQTPPAATGTACTESIPFGAPLVPTGLELCQDGRLHRPVAVECPSKLAPPGASDAGAGDGGAPRGEANATCTSDSDCTERPLGHCEEHLEWGLPYTGKTCDYGCRVDADCGPGALCQCGTRIGACVPANCQTDADCGSGLLCSQGTRSRFPGCPTVYEFFCEQPQDACRIDQDCVPAGYCAATDGARVCAVIPSGECGRPFLVEGSARLAAAQRSSDWLGAGASPDCSRLSAPERAQLARAWSQLGLMEHASVAAFARFTLQLLSVGAPASLIEQSQQALADELLHARLCFGLASTYAGQPIGPGPLPTEHALDLSSLEDISALTLHEGCVGETLAAIEASEALAHAQDPAVRAALVRIQADEHRHAELAWRFVTWAIQSGGASVQRRIRRELSTLVSPASEAMTTNAVDATSFDTALHGILSARQRAELRAAALREVVLPCALALLPVADIDLGASAQCVAW